MLMGPPPCQQEVSLKQPLHCIRMYLSSVIVLVGLIYFLCIVIEVLQQVTGYYAGFHG